MTDNEFHHDQLQQIEEFFILKKSYFKSMRPQERCLYSVINSRSKLKGFAFFKDKAMVELLCVSLATVKRTLKTLEENKLIYRNTWNIPGGKTRHIVTKENAMNYYRYWMCKPAIPKKVREKYIDDFLLYDIKDEVERGKMKLVLMGQSPRENDSYTRVKSDTCYTRVKSDPCLNPIRTLTEKREQISVAAFQESEEEKVKKEFAKSGVPVDQAWKYYQSVAINKKSPIAYTISAFKNGYAMGTIADIKQKQSLEPHCVPVQLPTEEEMCKQRRLVERVSSCVDRADVSISPSDYVVYLNLGNKSLPYAYKTSFEDFKANLFRWCASLKMSKCMEEIKRFSL